MPVETRVETYRRKLYSSWTQGGSQNVLVGFDDEVPVFGLTQRREFTHDPDWKQKVLAKTDASHPYLKRYMDGWSIKPAKLLARTTNGIIENADSTLMWDGGYTMPVGRIDATTDDIAVGRFRRKILRERKSFEALVPIAEAKDLSRTVRAAIDLTTSTVKTLLEIKRTKGRSAARWAGKAWLTYSFGVKPMLKDIEDLNASITEWLTRSDRVVRIASGADTKWVESVPGSGSVTFNRCATARSDHMIHHTLSYRYVAGFSLPLRSANNHSAWDHFGLSLPSLPSALWEATAFSWVADYFGTVGGYLEDAFETPSGVPVYVTKSRLHTARVLSTITPVPFEPAIEIISRSDGEASTNFIEFERTVLDASTFPRRSIRWKTGAEIRDNADSKLYNLASLLLQGSGRAPKGEKPLRLSPGHTRRKITLT